MNRRSEKRIAIVFRVSVVLKSLQGLLEIVAAFLFLFTSTGNITFFIKRLTVEELIENPHNRISLSLQDIGSSLSTTSKTYTVLFLLSHGLIKVLLIFGILKKRLWTYRAFIIIVGIFVIYQLYRYHNTHSLTLLVFTLFDVLLIFLTWHESRLLKRHLQQTMRL